MPNAAIPQPISDSRLNVPTQMANAEYLRRKVNELKEQATRLGSDAIDSLRGSRIGSTVAPTFEELRERARR